MSDRVRILLTGAAGFIGTYLSRELLAAGHDVIRTDYEDGDLTEPGVARRLVQHRKPEVFVHLAAKVGRLFGEENHRATVNANVCSTIYVAQACAEHGVRLVYGSTSEAFGDFGSESVDESKHGRLPYNLYGLSKRWGEEAARLYAPEKLQILRFSMPYGPGLPAGRGRAAIITFLWQAHHRKPMTVHRGGRRCLCWIGDLVTGARIIIESEKSGVWSVGRHDNEVSMFKVATMACEITDAPFDLIVEIEPPANQIVVKRLDISRLAGLGWRPCVDLAEGMRRTYDLVKLYDENGMPPSQWSEMIGEEVKNVNE